jgi:alpha-tubulin suppressor-like RCC1 family protein
MRAAAFGAVCALIAGAIAGCDGGAMTAPDGAIDAGGSREDGGGSAACEERADCDDGVFCNGVEQCDPSADGADENGCVSGPAACGEDEMCLEDDELCRPICAVEEDADGDGVDAIECGGTDCDDLDAERFPGNFEICDAAAHDEDCFEDTFGFTDADGDGAASARCCNVLADGSLGCGEDCNDADATINTRAGEGPPLFCDGIDNDCSGVADEGCPCVEGETRECGIEAQLLRIGTCRPGTNLCSGGAFTETCIGAVPPSEEICDGLDTDCDNMVDEGVVRTYYADVDGDGYGVAGMTTEACSAPEGYASNPDDCDDGRTGVSPAATEVCNGIDDNCSDTVDEGFTATFYFDGDGDGFGDPTMSTTACAPPTDYVRVATDCDDTLGARSPAAVEVCDGLDNNCDGRTDEGLLRTFYRDGDGDGWGLSAMSTSACSAPPQYVDRGNDCDDAAAGANPAAPEVCDGADNDCDGSSDEGVLRTFYRDGDRDGFGRNDMTMTACSAPSGHTDRGDDCNDTTSGVNPSAAELCNGRDDNCDGSTDTGCTCTDGATRSCGPSTEVGACAYGSQICVGGAWGDCIGAVLSSAETCNAIDDDCDGTIDNGVTVTGCLRDSDGDGFGTGGGTTQCRDASRGTFGNCPVGFTTSSGDCNDGVTTIRPNATEVCDGIDQDCDGTADDGATIGCYLDADGDAAGTGPLVQRCADSSRPSFGNCPSGYTGTAGDCNDGNGSVRVGATEVCNGIDDDCDNTVDDGVLATNCYADGDGDGYGAGPSSTQCRDALRTAHMGCPVGYTDDALDCNDASSAVRPGATEVCNAIDDNCLDGVDENLRVMCHVDGDSDGYGTGASTLQCQDTGRPSFGNCPAGYVNNTTDCNDTLASVRPTGTETCNGINDDCDAMIDEGVRITYYRDADNDGYGVTATTSQACTAPAGYVAASGDCNDTSPTINPGANELCNGIDENCTSGTTDEPRRTFYRDADGDLYGTSATTTTACSPPSGYVEYPGDCNDSTPSVRPGATEVCEGIDNDCDMASDEPPAAANCAGVYPAATGVASWACLSGPARCGIAACVAGRGDCDGSLFNGCETDTTNNALHCGGCNMGCGLGGRCTASTCDSVTSVAAGADTTCITRGSGALVCWGDGDTGVMTDATLPNAAPPRVIEGLVDVDAVDLGTHACAPNPGISGNLFCWGSNIRGEVGLGNTISPILEPSISAVDTTLLFAAYGNHTLHYVDWRLTRRLYSWGSNANGELGNGTVGGNVLVRSDASFVTGLPDITNVVSICAGENHSCAVSAGQVWCWGQDLTGQLGNGDAGADGMGDPDTGTPVRAGTLTNMVEVECGGQFTCARTSAGAAYCWGWNAGGQVGNNSTVNAFSPALVGGALTFADLELGHAHACGRTTTNRVYCWGYNNDGQLGSGTIGVNMGTPQQIVPNVTDATDIATGLNHSCMLRSGGDVYCWGGNNSEQLGFAGADRTTATLVPGL